ncbi:hypothetical protein QF001_005388 [Paraburkholderia youngii]
MGRSSPLAQQDAGLGGASPLRLPLDCGAGLSHGASGSRASPRLGWTITRYAHLAAHPPAAAPRLRPELPAWRLSAGRGVLSPLLQPKVYVGDFKCGRISGFRCRPRLPKTGRWRMEWPDASSDAGCARRDAGAGKFSADAEQYNTRGEVLWPEPRPTLATMYAVGTARVLGLRRHDICRPGTDNIRTANCRNHPR